jgi:probable rRNA maturation factor
MSADLDLDLDLQIASAEPDLPTRDDVARWVAAALDGRRARAALTVRIVDEAEGRALNLQYRGQDRPTNVLSFPFEPPPGIADLARIGGELGDGIADLIGDLVVCAPVVRREALEQGKAEPAHWAHLVVHGALHLLDYDHLTDPEAAAMEGLETAILLGLGFPPPYEEPSGNL